MHPIRKPALLAALLLLVIALSACAARAETGPAPIATDATAVDTDALTGILTDVSQNYHPATAGCSLVSLRLAGQLLDWNAENRADAETIQSTTNALWKTLDADAAELFSEQLSDVYAAAGELLGEDAKDQLEVAGYAPTSCPWKQSDVDAVFPALFAGIGAKLPA